MNFKFRQDIIHPSDYKILKNFEKFKEYYSVKYNICQEFQPKTIAEIGVRAGYSGWTFLQAVPSAHYFGIDANNGRHGGAGVEKYGWWEWAQNILTPYYTDFIISDTQNLKTLKHIIQKPIDFFHIDGDHTTSGVQHDLNLAFEVLSPKGIILVDDITYIKSVECGVKNWFKTRNDIEYEFRPSLRGEMIIKKIK